jgi:hypothetical protein
MTAEGTVGAPTCSYTSDIGRHGPGRGVLTPLPPLQPLQLLQLSKPIQQNRHRHITNPVSGILRS